MITVFAARHRCFAGLSLHIIATDVCMMSRHDMHASGNELFYEKASGC